MIGGDHQGKDYGRRAVELLLNCVKTRPGATKLLVSCVQGEGGPEDFYQKLGLEPTGKIYDGELGLVLPYEPLVAPLLPERSAALLHIPDHAQFNRDNWNRDASNWVESGRRVSASPNGVSGTSPIASCLCCPRTCVASMLLS